MNIGRKIIKRAVIGAGAGTAVALVVIIKYNGAFEQGDLKNAATIGVPTGVVVALANSVSNARAVRRALKTAGSR